MFRCDFWCVRLPVTRPTTNVVSPKSLMEMERDAARRPAPAASSGVFTRGGEIF